MAQIIGFLILIAVAVMALKVALVLGFFVALIFRPKETIGLIIVLGVLALFRNYPVASIAVGVIGTIAIVRINKKAAASKEVSEFAQITDKKET
jgi:hypothetical protein